MKKIILSAFVLLVCSFQHKTLAQDPVSNTLNTGAANYLTLPTDARSAGMGGAGVALPENNNAVFYNGSSALSNPERRGGVSYSYIPWLRNSDSDFALHTLGGFYNIDGKNAVLAGFRYYKYPSLSAIGENGNKKISPKEFSIDLGYAREIIPHLAISGTFRFIHSDLGNIGDAKSANAVAFDVGMLYNREITAITDAKWAAGFQLSNIGTDIKYLDTKEKLPMTAKIGGSLELPFYRIHKIMVIADLGYRFTPSDVSAVNVSAGAEYTLLQHFMLRGGYHYGDEDKGDASYATAGGGIKYYGVNVDFSWLFAGADIPFRNTFWISAGYSF